MNSIKYRDSHYAFRMITDLKDMVNSSAELFGDKEAYLVKDTPGGKYKPILYSQFKDDIDNLGTALLDMGLEGSKIGLIGENRYEWVISYLAVTNGVGVIVPLDRELGHEEIGSFMTRAGVNTIIYSSKLERTVEMVAETMPCDLMMISMDAVTDDENHKSLRKLITSGSHMVKAGKHAYLNAKIDPEVMCSLLFTSGTTGVPKGVMLSHKNIVTNVYAMSKYVNVSYNDTSLSVLPIHHTYEFTCHLMTAAYQGCRVAFCEGLKYIVRNMAESGASVLLAVPLIFENMHRKVWKNAEAKGKAKKMQKVLAISKLLGGQNIKATKRLFKDVYQAMGGKMRLMISGAAAIDPIVIDDFCAMGMTMIQGYGMTECAPIITLNRDRYSKAASAGVALPGTEVRIIDGDENGIGEVICRSDSVMIGYYEDPEGTAQTLMDGWLHTGDYGYLDPEGFLFITGRKKNLIVTKNGKNISPEELETYLYRIPLIAEVIVKGKDDPKNGDTIICADIFPDSEYIKSAYGEETKPDEIKRLLKTELDKVNEKLPIYKRIRRFTVREQPFEKTSTQKIIRNSIK